MHVGDALWVVQAQTLYRFDPETGAILAKHPLDTLVRDLATDGKRLWTASRTELLRVDPETGAIDLRVPVHYPVRALAAHGGALYLMEQPVFGHDREHKQVRLWPKTTHIHKLTLP